MRAPSTPLLRGLLAGLLLGLVASAGPLACGKGVPRTVPAAAPAPATAARDARLALEEARRRRQQGRFEAALRVNERALLLTPDDPAVQRLQASLLEDLGRSDEADAHRRRAAALTPATPLPDVALAGGGRDWLIVLRPPPEAERARRRAPAAWPDGPENAVLRQRLALRLPEAQVVAAPSLSDASLPSLRQWLAAPAPHRVMSLQLERAWCGESIKDGRFSLVWMRAAVAVPTGAEGRAHQSSAGDDDVIPAREVLADPPEGPDCAAEAVARALEQLLVAPALHKGLERPAPPAGAALGRAAIHRLFPELDRHIDLAREEGRRWLAVGSLEDARRAFERAALIDPDDLDTRSYLAEIDATLELTQQLARRRGHEGELSPVLWSEPDAGLPNARRDFLEAQLRDEERRRQELLALLAVLADERRGPAEQTLAVLHPSAIADPAARGPALARGLLADAFAPAPVSAADPRAAAAGPSESIDSDLEVRVLHDQRGKLVARYYFARGSPQPLLVEEDSRGDGTMDRWIAYRDGRRQQVWEAGDPAGASDLHIVYADDGEQLERIELDGDGDGRVERVFAYEAGRLASELRDSSGDGRFDQVQHYDREGLVRLREEDIDADGRIDVRTVYSRGRIMRREIMNPEAAVQVQ